jgi:hypothetical protein
MKDRGKYPEATRGKKKFLALWPGFTLLDETEGSLSRMLCKRVIPQKPSRVCGMSIVVILLCIPCDSNLFVKQTCG